MSNYLPHHSSGRLSNHHLDQSFLSQGNRKIDVTKINQSSGMIESLDQDSHSKSIASSLQHIKQQDTHLQNTQSQPPRVIDLKPHIQNLNNQQQQQQFNSNMINLKQPTIISAQNTQQQPRNNIIIDLTNKLYQEEEEQQNKQKSKEQAKNINTNTLLDYNSKTIQSISEKVTDEKQVTQKEIDDFKKQIQIDLQQLTQALEQNTKKQYEEMREESRRNRQVQIEQQHQEQRQQIQQLQEQLLNYQRDLSQHRIDGSHNISQQDIKSIHSQVILLQGDELQSKEEGQPLNKSYTLMDNSDSKNFLHEQSRDSNKNTLQKQRSLPQEINNSFSVNQSLIQAYANKAGPQSMIQVPDNIQNIKQSVQSMPASNSQKQSSHNQQHQRQPSGQQQVHNRTLSKDLNQCHFAHNLSHISNAPDSAVKQNNNQFYLNLQNLNQNVENQSKYSQQTGKSNSSMTVYQQALHSTGFRNQYQSKPNNALNNARSNSRDQKSATRGNNSNYQTKSPQSYSSITSAPYNPTNKLSTSKSRANQQAFNTSSHNISVNHSKNLSMQKNKNKSSLSQTGQTNLNRTIVEEDFQSSTQNNMEPQLYYGTLQENDDLKHQLHQLRLKNAEHRGEIQKLKRENNELLNHNNLLEERCKQTEKQRKKDGEYILKQDSEIEKLIEVRNSQSGLVKVQEDQITNLKAMLNQTINVKIKYENIIKRLVENERTREVVLATIEQVQQNSNSTGQVASSASYAVPQPQIPQELQNPFNNSGLFGSSMLSNNQVKSSFMSGHNSMNQTQNISQILANAAAKVLGKSQRLNNNGLANLKPSDVGDEEEEEEDEVDQKQIEQDQDRNKNQKQIYHLNETKSS